MQTHITLLGYFVKIYQIEHPSCVINWIFINFFPLLSTYFYCAWCTEKYAAKTVRI